MKNVVKMMLILTLVTVLILSGCSSKKTTTTSEQAEGAVDATEVRKIVVGTGNGFKPYCYLDENGALAGYELEILKKVDEMLPQYEFEYQTMDFPNILISLETKKIDLAAHQFEINPEREKKFLFTKEPYTTFILRITIDKDRTDINTVEDLHGKTVKVTQGANDAYIMEEYNKAHDNAINLVYSSEDTATTVKNIEDGRYDAFISITRVVETLNQTYGDKLKTIGEPVASSSTYYLVRQDDVQLQADIDGAIKKLKEEGTLSQISIDILDGDYTTND